MIHTNIHLHPYTYTWVYCVTQESGNAQTPLLKVVGGPRFRNLQPDLPAPWSFLDALTFPTETGIKYSDALKQGIKK